MFPIQQFMRFAMNPVQYFNQMGIQIPQDCQTPNQMVQYLMNSGRLNQQQYNSIVQQSNQIQKDPQFNQLVNSVNKSNSNVTPNTVSDNKQI
jgi:hypothetical protein